MSKATDYCIKVFDGTHTTPKPTKKGYRLLTSKNIMDGYLDKTDSYFISEEDYISINKRSRVKKWDVLFGMIGTVGNVCIITDDKIDYAIKNMGVFSCEDEYKAKWLYFYLKSPYVKKLNQNYLNGAIQKFLPLGYLRDLEIPDFTPDKIKVVDFLWSLEEKIRVNNKIDAELDKYLKEVFSLWFISYDFPNEEGKPYKSNGGSMIWNDLLQKKIPENWAAEKVGERINVIRGVSFNPDDTVEKKTDGFVQLLKSNNIQNDRVNFDNIVSVKKDLVSEDQYLTKGSIFVTMSSGSTAHVGKTAIIFYDMPYCFGAFCSKIEIQNDYQSFIASYFNSELFKTTIRTIVSGTSIKNISNNHLTDNVLAFPDKKTLRLFDDIYFPIFNERGNLQRQNIALKEEFEYYLVLLMNNQATFNEDL